MLKRIFWKSLWHVKKDYFVLMMVGILIVFSVFFTTAVTSALTVIKTGESVGGIEILKNAEGVFLFTYIVYLFLFVYFLLSYIRKRYGEYEMFMTLGMKTKHLHKFVSMEYFGIIFISLFVGIILGTCSSVLLNMVLYRIFPEVETEIFYGLTPYVFTIIISVIIFGLSYVACDLMITWFGIDEVVLRGKKASKLIAKPKAFLIAGIVVFVLGYLTIFTYWGKVGKTVPVVLGEAAIYLLMLSGVGIYLRSTLKNRNQYYANILWLEAWYHRFFYNVYMSFVATAFLFAIAFIYLPQFVDNYPLVEEDNYPYDLVWMANDTDQLFLNEIEEKYNLDIDRIPCVRVTAPDFGEHMGISASIYEQWTGTKLHLTDREVYVIYQRERENRVTLGVDYGRKQPRLHIGMAKPDLWILNAPTPLPSAKFNEKFELVGQTDQILTGVFQSRQVGKLYGDVFEDIIVFSDEYFHRVKDSAEGANLAVLINGIDEGALLKEEIYAYAKENSEVNFFDSEKGNIIYEKTECLLESTQQNIYNVVEAALNIIGMFLCMVVIVFFKNKNEFTEIHKKYRLYTMLGISRRKRKKWIVKQMFFPLKISTVIGGIVMLVFCIRSILERHMNIDRSLKYCIVVILGIAGADLLLKLITYVQACDIVKKSGKE